MTELRSLPRTANHYGAYYVRVEGGRVRELLPVEGDEDPSPIGRGLVESVDSPLRIAEPAVRRSYLEHGPATSTELRGAEPFVAVSWDEAERLVAAEIERVRRTHGNASIFAGSYGWGSAGQFHHAQGHLYRLLNLVGGFTRSVNTYSLAAAENIMPHVMGPFPWLQGQHTSWPSIIGHTELMVCFGGMPLKNSQINYRGVARHTQRGYMREAREAGIAFVNVGPLRDDVADFLDAEWLPARPNTDVAIMLGLAHTLLEEGRHDEDFLSRYCVGFERFAAYLRGESDGRPKDVAWAAELSGLDAEMLRGLARRMADSRTMINMSWSLNRQDHGEQPFWTGAALAAMLGQVGLPGGGVAFGYAATSNMGLHSHRMRWAGLNPGPFPVDDLIPVSRIADMLLNPGAAFDFNGRRLRFPDVRLLYWLGGNPFHHHQDLNRLLRAWRRPETVVVHEPWWTPLARHADIALPATTPLERNDFVTSPSDPRVLAVQRCIAPYAESRNDFDILAGIADRLGCAQGFTEGRSEMDWLRHLHDQNRQRAAEQGFTLPDFDTFWREGECGLPEREDLQVMHGKFRADPEGNGLRTPSGRIEIFSETIEAFEYDDCPGHPAWIEPAEWLGSPLAARFPLHLVSNQPVTRLHSQYDASELSRAAKVSGREAIRLNPGDAQARGIAAGDVVRVFNDRGQCLAGAVPSDAVRPGVAQMATGAWYDPAQPGEIGSLCKHGNVNVLTLDKGTSRLAQGSSAHTCLVEVERYEGEPPPVTAFDPPTIERR